MGALKDIDIKSIQKKFSLKTFIESGTGNGDGLATACNVDFEHIYSIEIIKSQADIMSERYAHDSRVTIFHGHTTDVLNRILPNIDGDIFFWLDAHFPGADLGLAGYEDEKNEDIRLPLELELRTIKTLRKGKRDLITFDDLRLYKNQGVGAIYSTIMPKRPFPSNTFYEEILSDTHTFAECLDDYGILIPRSRK